jgi:hypothetical protein
VPDQIRLGRIAIDAGAAAVVGCHAHVIQTFEEYKGCWIFHGIGNYYFDPVRARSFRAREMVGEFDILHQDRRNRESLVPVFDVHGSRLELADLFVTRWDTKYPAPVGSLGAAAINIEAANSRLKLWTALRKPQIRRESEIQFRCSLQNGTIKYDYVNRPIGREWRLREFGARVYRHALSKSVLQRSDNMPAQ